MIKTAERSGQAPTSMGLVSQLRASERSLHQKRRHFKSAAALMIYLVKGERHRRKGQHKNGECDPPDQDSASSKRDVRIDDGRMRQTPYTGHERPDEPSGPPDESQEDQHWD